MALRYVVATGNFSNGAIWDNGAVPTSADDVYANGFTVTIDGTYTVQTIRNTVSPISIPNIATPAMTSNNTPSGIVFASSSNSNLPWNAFSQDSNTTFWQSGVANTGILGYQFPSGKVIKRYILRMVSTNTVSFPTAWTFQGSNDGVSYTTLDTVTGAAISLGGNYVSSVLANTTSYTYYRINITAVNTLGTSPSIAEFELTESTNSVYGGVAGGQFIYANGGNLTTTASTGIIPGIASVPVLEMTLASPNTATFNGSVLTMINGFSYIAIRHSSSGTLNLNGNYNLDGIVARTLILVTSTGTLNIIGNVTGNYTVQFCNTLSMSAAGTINITGDVIGSNTGQVNSSTVIASLGTINITGNTTGATNPAINLTGAVNYTQIGNVNASTTQPAINNQTAAATISVTGIITAGNSSPAVNGITTTFVIVRGNVVNTDTYAAIYAGRVTIDNNVTSWQFKDSTNTITRTLYTAGVNLGNPAITNVRLGTTYGASGELTGTLTMPTPETVLLGVLTDATTGTLLMTPADFWNYLISSGFTDNSIGDRLQNAATVATTGGQIASYSI